MNQGAVIFVPWFSEKMQVGVGGFRFAASE